MRTRDQATRITPRPSRVATLVACCGLACALAGAPAMAQERVKGVEVPRPGVKQGEPAKQQPAMRPGQPVTVPPSPVQAPGAVPGAKAVDSKGGQPSGPLSSAGDEMVTLSAFTEAVSLASLVDMVAATLEINVATKGDVPGTVVFNAPVPVKRSELISLLDQLLEQQGWTITKDRFGFYTVQPVMDVKPVVDSLRATTRVFSTPNIRPTSLKPAIENQFQGSAQQGGGMARQYTYIDELGVIVATDTPRKLEAVDEIIKTITAVFQKSEFIRLELTHIAAPVAKERALQLIGQIAQPLRNDQNGQVPQPVQNFAGQPGQVGALSNMGDRLTVDPQGNALVFRGLPEEVEDIRKLLAIIDRPNALVPKQYFAGSAAKQIADLARGQGLGEVTTIARAEAGAVYTFQQDGSLGQQRSNAIGGPVMVVDEGSGNIIYYATPQQQERLAALIKELDTKAERIVLETYKLRSSDSEDVADILNSLISNSQPLGSSPLLPGGQGQTGSRRPIVNNAAQQNAGGYDGSFGLDADAFVIADISNNQVIVKARAGQQQEFARLIQKLDKRKPQVYVEAMIVAVNSDDKFRLAFETQLINAHGTGGVLNTNFGLGTFADAGTQPIRTAKTVATSLSGFTAALIKSDQVPIIMTALARNTDSRIISSPQLLVDDNEEASVVSLDERPTTTVTPGSNGGRDIVSPGSSAQAGTTLIVTPQIADSNALRLKYELELSSFTGEAQVVGGAQLAPPKQTNTLKSESVTVPSDCTVVVGGLVVQEKTGSVVKVPLIGDIPLIGALFRDKNTGNRKTTLYVFLTPRIIRDPNFEDLKLLSQGPQSASSLAAEFPTLVPRSIDLSSDDAADSARPLPPITPPAAQTPAADVQPPLELPDAPPAPEPQKPAVHPITPVRDSDKNEINPD